MPEPEQNHHGAIAAQLREDGEVRIRGRGPDCYADCLDTKYKLPKARGRTHPQAAVLSGQPKV